MKHWWKHPADPIPVLCIGLCLVLWLGGGVWRWGSDLAARATGRMEPFALTAQDLTPVNLQATGDNTYQTETEDPQLLWDNPDGRRIRSLTLTAAFSASPREICLYYTTAPGEDYSVEHRVFPTEGPDGSYRFVLPHTPVASLRLDPCSPLTGQPIAVTLESLTGNGPVPVWQYFAPGWFGLVQAVLYTALACALLCIVRDAVMWYKKK